MRSTHWEGRTLRGDDIEKGRHLEGRTLREKYTEGRTLRGEYIERGMYFEGPFQSNHLRAIVLERPAQSYRPRTPVPKKTVSKRLSQSNRLRTTVPVLEQLSQKTHFRATVPKLPSQSNRCRATTSTRNQVYWAVPLIPSLIEQNLHTDINQASWISAIGKIWIEESR